MNQAKILRGAAACCVVAMLATGGSPAEAIELGAYIAPGYSLNTIIMGNARADDVFESGLGATFDSSSLDKKTRGYSLAVGYQLTRNFAVEGAWINLGKMKYDFTFTANDPDTGLPGQFAGRITNRRSGMAFAGVGTLPLGAVFALDARAGFLFGEHKLRVYVEDEPFTGFNDGKTSLFYGVGATWFVTPYTGVVVGFNRFRQGHYEADVNQLSIGFRYSYGY
jgi:OmpA-OmpF porin, OOP family